MAKEVGFTTMGSVNDTEGEIPELGVGMIGYAFMGKAHSNAYRQLNKILFSNLVNLFYVL